MKKKYLALVVTMVITMSLAAQTDSFDIATFKSPKGWQRTDSNGVLLFHDYRTKNNLISFCQIFIYPSKASTNTAEKNFSEEWNMRVVQPTRTNAKPVTSSEKTPDGWTAVTGMANISQQGITYTCMLVAVTGFGREMSIVINMAGQDHVAEMQAFMSSFELDSKASAASPNRQLMPSGNFDWSNYQFIAPERWYSQTSKDGIWLSQTQNLQEGCVITILPPQPSSGNLETDARNIFTLMYPGGWKYRQTGERQYDLARGFTSQGLEYCTLEAPMHRQRPDGYYYDYEDGAVWIIGLNNKQVAVVTGRHNRLMACFCNHQYEYWRRFFNSFTVKNQAPAKNTEDISKRIIGDWMTMGGSALTEYIFAANGNYQFIGAYSSTSTRSDAYNDYIQIKTSAWKGDGSYTIKGNQITFNKYGKQPDQVKFRFEKVNHGGTGWKDRLYMRQISTIDGKEFEVCYEKRNP